MTRIEEMKRIRCTVMRGGTSKGVYILENELPADSELRKKVILAIFGSPDKRQIDGLGGADPLTSKLAIVGPSRRSDADVSYTYAQVAINEPNIYTRGICGNISSGVGPFSIDEGLVKAVEPVTTVRIFNTNTGKIFIAEVPTVGGKAAVEGDYEISGVPGTGAKVTLDFSQTAGAITGKLLPTGNVKDKLVVKGVGELTVSIVDLSTVEVYFRAEDIGLTGTESPDDVDQNPELRDKLETIRGTAAAKIGMVSSPEAARKESGNTPHLVFVSEATNYTNHLTREVIEEKEIDFVARMMYMQIMHKTYAGTGLLCTGVAAMIDGTVINDVIHRGTTESGVLRIGHPGGIAPVEVKVEKRNGNYIVQRIAIGRTARRIMEGYVFVRRSIINSCV